MRQTILTLLAASATLAAYAHPISPGEAKSIASEFFNSGSGPKRAPKAVQMSGTDSKSQTTQPYYIFNAADGNGFVIISGDSRARRILGYSDSGTFTKENVPPQLQWLLSEYEKSMETIPANAPTPRQNITRSAEQNYLLTTQWGQGDPYNAKCPFVNGGRAVTGCVATAMAQIINYENKTSHVEAIPEYWCAVEMPALPPYEFNYGHLDNDEIATLMLYCGQSVRMDYGFLESGSAVQDVPDALRNYFGWEPGVRTMEREKYNDEHWNRMVKEEISKGHPLLYSAVGDQGWHAFVVDGVSDDLFHVNWGWDGYLDGYYSFQPLAQDHQSDFIHMQWMVAVRDDDPSADIITYGTTIDGINYELMDDLTAVVLPLKDGNKYRGDLVIPGHVNFEGKTYTVNYFGPNAFVNCEHLESISIPATIIGQEWSVFEGCENLHKVNVEDMAAFIRLDVGGFHTGSPLAYGGDLYLNGELVKDLVIPEGIEAIGYRKFSKCQSIERVTMSSTAKKIGQESFSECPNLKIVHMAQSSIELIDIGAFTNDKAIIELTLPNTLRSIMYTAFLCCDIKKITSLATTPPWTQDEVFSSDRYGEIIIYVPDESLDLYRQAKGWKEFIDIYPLSEEKPLPETVIVSDEYMTYEINLTEKYAKVIGGHNQNVVFLPYSIEYSGYSYPIDVAGYGAFACSIIKQLEAPLRKIAPHSFYESIFEGEFELPSTLRTIPKQGFLHARIPYLILHDKVSQIGPEAFKGDENDDWRRVFAIESRNPQPPVISDDTFDNLTYDEVPLKVPFGSKKAYALANGWRNFKNVTNIGDEQEETLDYDLSLLNSSLINTVINDRMPLSISVTVRNSGFKRISGFTLYWEIDGKTLGEKHYEVGLDQTQTFLIEEKITPRVESTGEHELKLSIYADGIDDRDISDNEVSLTFKSFDKGFYRVSLFEQFTSESCGLTPHYAPLIMEGIRNSGQSDFLAQVTHHCGFYEDFLTLNYDYEWFYNYDGPYTPAIMINRTDIQDTGHTPVNGVPDDLEYQLINQAGICDALVSVYCKVEDDVVTVKTLLEKNEDFNLEAGYDYLTVFLLEDSIPAREQLDAWSGGYAENYIHRNTIRKVLSGIWGNKISWKDNVCALKFESSIDKNWNKDNLKAVAFIHRYNPVSPIDCQVYTANSSELPQYGINLDDSEYLKATVNSLTLTPDNIICYEGDSFNIIANVLPENLSNKDLSWTTSNEEIVTVDSEGIVTAVGAGVATVFATALDGFGTFASCLITVNPSVPAESISIDNVTYSGYIGESFIVTATVLPENTTSKTIWSSSNENIAKIITYDYDTVIEIVGVGKVTITASCGNLSDSFELLCYPIPADADWNGAITITDAVDIANYVVEKKTAPADWNVDEWKEFYFIGANVNGDNSVTFADAVATVSLALDQPVYESPAYLPSNSVSHVEDSTDSLIIGEMYDKGDRLFVIPVYLENTMEYVAIQADITLPTGMTIESINSGGRIIGTHNLTTRSINDRSMRMAIFDIRNSTFANSNEPIFEIVAKSNDITSEETILSNIIAADPDAKEYVLSSRVSTTSVDAIQDVKIHIEPLTNGIYIYNAASKEVIISTLDGRIIKSFVPVSDAEKIQLHSGIYIVKAGDKHTKCIVR